MKRSEVIRSMKSYLRNVAFDMVIGAPLMYLLDVGFVALTQHTGYIERFLEGPDKVYLGISLPTFASISIARKTIRDYRSRRNQPISINGFKVEAVPEEYTFYLYVQRGELEELVGKFRNEEDETIFTNLAEDLMCYTPRRGFLGRFRKPKRLDYGEEVSFGEVPHLYFGHGKPEIGFIGKVKEYIMPKNFPEEPFTGFSKN